MSRLNIPAAHKSKMVSTDRIRTSIPMNTNRSLPLTGSIIHIQLTDYRRMYCIDCSVHIYRYDSINLRTQFKRWFTMWYDTDWHVWCGVLMRCADNIPVRYRTWNSWRGQSWAVLVARFDLDVRSNAWNLQTIDGSASSNAVRVLI